MTQRKIKYIDGGSPEYWRQRTEGFRLIREAERALLRVKRAPMYISGGYDDMDGAGSWRVLWQIVVPNMGAPSPRLGLGRIGFLTDPNYALATLTWITGWKLIGFSTLLFSAANGGINPSYIEAARIDGAATGRSYAISPCRCCRRPSCSCR